MELAAFPVTLEFCKPDDQYFEFNLNKELDFSKEQYEVCLQDIIFTSGSYRNVREGSNWFNVINSIMTLSGEFPSKQYTSRGELLKAINDAVFDLCGRIVTSYIPGGPMRSELGEKVFPWDAIPLRKKWKPGMKWHVHYMIGGHFLYLDTREHMEKIYNEESNLGPLGDKVQWYTEHSWLRPGETAYENLISNDCRVQWIPYDYKKETKIHLSNEVLVLLGVLANASFSWKLIYPNDFVYITQISMTKNNISMLFVFADFIGNSLVGPELEPLLKVVPIFQVTDAINHSVFHIPQYVPVHRRKISKLRFNIKASINDKYNIQFYHPVTFVLYFKPMELE